MRQRTQIQAMLLEQAPVLIHLRMNKTQKLELTRMGKENRPRLEPRILLEDPRKLYHAQSRVRIPPHVDALCDPEPDGPSSGAGVSPAAPGVSPAVESSRARRPGGRRDAHPTIWRFRGRGHPLAAMVVRTSCALPRLQPGSALDVGPPLDRIDVVSKKSIQSFLLTGQNAGGRRSSRKQQR